MSLALLVAFAFTKVRTGLMSLFTSWDGSGIRIGPAAITVKFAGGGTWTVTATMPTTIATLPQNGLLWLSMALCRGAWTVTACVSLQSAPMAQER